MAQDNKVSLRFNRLVIEQDKSGQQEEGGAYTLTYQPVYFDLSSDQESNLEMTFPGANKELLESIRDSNRQIYNGFALGLLIIGKC